MVLFKLAVSQFTIRFTELRMSRTIRTSSKRNILFVAPISAIKSAIFSDSFTGEVTDGGTESVFEIAEGDCLNKPDDAGAEVYDVEVRSEERRVGREWRARWRE